ncbi:MAG: DUF4434 domain-containing protein [Planctomycetota bacterium]
MGSPAHAKIITGTFLDGLPCDIPSQNWGRLEWERQFHTFAEMGMDTCVIIRVGWQDLAMYPSRVMDAPVSAHDLVALFLELAAREKMRLYMGLYDTNRHWLEGRTAREAEVNLDLIEELLDRYGEHEAFHGWYLSHEPGMEYRPWEIWGPLVRRMRERTPKRPILVSPRYEGRKWKTPWDSPKTCARRFAECLGKVEGRIDAAAFMDGHVAFGELADYAAAMKEALDEAGTSFWSNLETFDRDMPIKYPPIDWNKMRMKLEAVQGLVEKIITFEAPHFLSPHSTWESAGTLYARYLEYIDAASRGESEA